MTQPAAVDSPAHADSPHPPVTQLAVGSLVLVLIGGIYMAGSYPAPPSMAVPAVLVAASVALWTTGVVLMARHPGFAWPIFSRVARWALLAYVVEAGMIEFSFIHNHVTGAALLLISLMLVMFALAVTLSIAYTVARFATPSD
jgi:hypothetical protein